MGLKTTIKILVVLVIEIPSLVENELEPMFNPLREESLSITNDLKEELFKIYRYKRFTAVDICKHDDFKGISNDGLQEFIDSLVSSKAISTVDNLNRTYRFNTVSKNGKAILNKYIQEKITYLLTRSNTNKFVFSDLRRSIKASLRPNVETFQEYISDLVEDGDLVKIIKTNRHQYYSINE